MVFCCLKNRNYYYLSLMENNGLFNVGTMTSKYNLISNNISNDNNNNNNRYVAIVIFVSANSNFIQNKYKSYYEITKYQRHRFHLYNTRSVHELCALFLLVFYKINANSQKITFFIHLLVKYTQKSNDYFFCVKRRKKSVESYLDGA